MSEAVDRTSAAVLWNAISANLRETLAPPTYSAWFGRASGRSLHDESLEVWWRCVQLLGLFAVMFTTLGLMLFEPLTEE